MFRKEEAAVTDWTEDTNAICANRQLEILTSAAGMLRPGGRLVYSTCTFSPVENEGVISEFCGKSRFFCRKTGRAVLFSRQTRLGAKSPRRDWKTFRLWPHKLLGEGHYAAVLRRAGDEAPAALHRNPRPNARRSLRRSAARPAPRCRRGSCCGSGTCAISSRRRCRR